MRNRSPRSFNRTSPRIIGFCAIGDCISSSSSSSSPPGPTRADHAAGAAEEGRGAGRLQVCSPNVFVVVAVVVAVVVVMVVVVVAAAMQGPCSLAAV